MDANYIAKNLYYLRKKKRVTQADMALQVKKGQTTIGNWENGVSQPNIEELLFLSNFFGVSIDNLLKVDLEKGNLTESTDVQENDKKGNLKGNVKGNLTPVLTEENRQNPDTYGHGFEPESFVINDNKEPKRPVLLPRVIHVDTNNEENAVFIPVKARAGYLQGFGDLEFMGKLTTYKIIGRRDRTYRIFEVDGNSMYPTLNDKDTVNAYAVSVSDIRDERIHVLVTRNDGILIKRVINRYKEGKLICKSDNFNRKGEYPPIVLPIHDVMEVWYVDSRTSHNLTPPGEIYERISNLEANLYIMMDNAGLLKPPEK